MRVESTVTSISWIPSEVVSGLPKLGFKIGLTHFDPPPPDVLDDLDRLHALERFRFANRLSAWIEVEEGQVVDAGGGLVAKSGLADSHKWFKTSFGTHSPWGEEDSKAFFTLAETALERQLSVAIMQGGQRPSIRRLPGGAMLTAEGEVAREVYLLLDGVLEVVVGQETLGQLGPGAIVGERALLEDGRRTASLRALTPCTVAIADESRLDPHELETLAEGHRREDT